MAEITVRVLREEEWKTFREVRLAALKESPDAFVRTYDEEAAFTEDDWRDRLRRSRRFVAEEDGDVLGLVCLGEADEDDDSGAADVFGLWVAPRARNTGLSWRLVEEAARQAAADGRERLYYWVGTENGRAIAFATNFGFRPSGKRRPAKTDNDEFSDLEVAMVLSLSADPGSGGVPNPQRPGVAGRSGPAL